MSLDQNKLLVCRLVDEAQVAGRLEVVDELLSEDFVDHTPMEGVPGNREGVRMLFAAMLEAFPDLTVDISEQIAEGDRVVTRKTLRGTHGGSFLGLPPTGSPVRFEVVDILTIRDERFVEHRAVIDKLNLMQQLGAVPA
jgi:steroid delta-isomerase-like uncharacterized protein